MISQCRADEWGLCFTYSRLLIHLTQTYPQNMWKTLVVQFITRLLFPHSSSFFDFWGDMFISELFLFCDGSVHASTQQGCGAYLITDTISAPLSVMAATIKTQVFDHTSSTRLELQTLLYALSCAPAAGKVTVLTDSQNIIGLPARRKKLEAQAFCSRQGKLLSNADLYRSFFNLLDKQPCELIKVKGHSQASGKTKVEQIFALVDQAARRGCRML